MADRADVTDLLQTRRLSDAVLGQWGTTIFRLRNSDSFQASKRNQWNVKVLRDNRPTFRTRQTSSREDDRQSTYPTGGSFRAIVLWFIVATLDVSKQTTVSKQILYLIRFSPGRRWLAMTPYSHWLVEQTGSTQHQLACLNIPLTSRARSFFFESDDSVPGFF